MQAIKQPKIVSGGQTGVDRAALDAALAHCWPCGGWCPEGRQAEDGPIPDHYPLQMLPRAGYRERTLQNVLDSDATVIVHFGLIDGGSALTQKFCRARNRPYLLLDGQADKQDAFADLRNFIKQRRVEILNLAGPRASKQTAAYAYTYSLLSRWLQEIGGCPQPR